MFVLKLEKNIFEELSQDRITEAVERREGDSVYRSLSVDFSDLAEVMIVEKRKYPYFYKYYLYLDKELSNPVDFKSEKGVRFLLAFYGKYCPDYVKTSAYEPESGKGLEDYFYRERIPGDYMQHFTAAESETDGIQQEKQESDSGDYEKSAAFEKKKGEADEPAVSVLEGYHAFTEDEKEDIGSQLDALKNQFAEQLKDLEGLLKQSPKDE